MQPGGCDVPVARHVGRARHVGGLGVRLPSTAIMEGVGMSSVVLPLATELGRKMSINTHTRALKINAQITPAS